MSLKSLIKSHMDDGKVFYSMEITPKTDVHINFSEFVKLPLFVNLTWIKDDNLKVALTDSQTINAECLKLFIVFTATFKILVNIFRHLNLCDLDHSLELLIVVRNIKTRKYWHLDANFSAISYKLYKLFS